jgi:hypothetical protein
MEREGGLSSVGLGDDNPVDPHQDHGREELLTVPGGMAARRS